MQLIEIVYTVYLKSAVFAMYMYIDYTVNITVNSNSDPFVNTTLVCISVTCGNCKYFTKGKDY